MISPPVFSAFTIEFSGLVREIITGAGIWLPLRSEDLVNIPIDEPRIIKTHALWDTGATGCCITPKAAKALEISPIRTTRVHFGDGEADANVYLISLFLPNNVVMPLVQVTECKNENATWDIIIGMDVIGQSDFSITNVGHTKMSFRHPSLKEIDYVKEANDWKALQFKGVGRNDPCPCGSTKKFKYCHGLVSSPQ